MTNNMNDVLDMKDKETTHMKNLLTLLGFLGFTLIYTSTAWAQGDIESVSPSSGSLGESLILTIRGDASVVFSDDSTVFLEPAELWCTGVTLYDSNEIRCDLDIPDLVSLLIGAQNVVVTSFATEYVGEDMFVILSVDEGSISGVSPDSAVQGNSEDIVVTGSGTSWDSGTTLAFSPDDIEVLSLQADDATHLSAQIRVASNAALGEHDVIAVTSGQEVVGSGLFSVEEQTISLSPASGVQGETLGSVTISGGPGGYSATSEVNLGEGVTVGSFSGNDTSLTLSDVSIAANAPVGHHDLNLRVGGNDLDFGAVFAVYQGAATRLLSVTPNHGDAGHPALALTLLGQNTHFDAAGLELSTSEGGIFLSHRINAGPEEVTAVVWLLDDTARTVRDLQVRLGSSSCEVCEKVMLTDAFEVTEPGLILSLSPARAGPGDTPTVSITASDGAFIAGQTQVVFEPPDGIEVLAVRVTDSDHLEMDLEIAAEAIGDPRTIRAHTGTEVAVGLEAFDIHNPSLRTIRPTSAFQGTMNLSITVEGIDVVFDTSAGLAFSGDGITVGPAQPDAEHPEQFTVSVDVAADALPVARDVTVTQGELELVIERGFTVVVAPQAQKDGGCACAAGNPSDTSALSGLFLGLAFACFRRRRQYR